MAARKKVDESAQPLRLLVSRDEAASRIDDRIDKGRILLGREFRSRSDYDEVQREYRKWSDFNEELLRQIFNTPSVAEEYAAWYGGIAFIGEPDLGRDIRDLRDDIQTKITRLESIRDRTEIIPVAAHVEEDTEGAPRQSQGARDAVSLDIFIVHGRDGEAREAVARFVEKLGLNAIILHEQPNAGKTIIEKFEAHAAVGFAVVLLTGDDKGGLAEEGAELHPRARQNVIFEFGYFAGKIGRQKVCALYQEGVELPSDLNGLVYVPLDRAGKWRLDLAKEMKQAGIPVDLNKAM
jgi:predicted nucleotide-binding protein